MALVFFVINASILVTSDVECCRVYINKHWCEPEQCDHFGCRNISMHRKDHFITRFQTERHHSDLERVGSVGTRYYVHTAQVFRQAGCKLLYFFSLDECRRIDN